MSRAQCWKSTVSIHLEQLAWLVSPWDRVELWGHIANACAAVGDDSRARLAIAEAIELLNGAPRSWTRVEVTIFADLLDARVGYPAAKCAATPRGSVPLASAGGRSATLPRSTEPARVRAPRCS